MKHEHQINNQKERDLSHKPIVNSTCT